jgi:hypothetical protein
LRSAALLLTFLLPFLVASSASWADSPGALYDVKATWGDTNLPPGGEGRFLIQVRNIGDLDGAGPLVITDSFPAALTITNIDWSYTENDKKVDLVAEGACPAEDGHAEPVSSGTHELECELSAKQVAALAKAPGLTGTPTGYLPPLFVDVQIAADAAGTAVNIAAVSGGGSAQVARDIDEVLFSATPAPFGVVPGSFSEGAFDAAYPFGSPVRQAGAHPFELRLSFDLNAGTPRAGGEIRSSGLIRTARISLPPGLIANPEALPRCSAVDFAGNVCPSDTQVGYLNISTSESARTPFLSRLPLYNVVPPTGELGDFAFNYIGLIMGHVYPKLDPTRGYATEARISYISSMTSLRGAEVTLWGVPGDPAHDKFRAYPGAYEFFNRLFGAPFDSTSIHPLLTNPMDCDAPRDPAAISADSYEHPGEFTEIQAADLPAQVEGCGDPRVRFDPEVRLRPDGAEAGAPNGLGIEIHLPQRDDEVAEATQLYTQNGSASAIATPPLRHAVIALPAGMTISPSAAQGLGACGESQIGLLATAPISFDASAPSCPESSRIGSVTATTPILPQPLGGSIYLAAQDENPFNTLLAVYVVLEDPSRGILIKMPARLDLDPDGGRVTVTLDDLPQLPMADLSLHFKSGPRAPLLAPQDCGLYAAAYAFTSWADPTPVRGTADFPVDGGCAHTDFHPGFSAGTASSAAGAASPFLLELSRDDREPNLAGFSLTLPSGLSASFDDIPRCPDVDAARGSCPAASRVGTVTIAAGAGAAPLWIPQPGQPSPAVYLAGSYRGAPFSLVAVVSARAGPFDLGPIALRAPIEIDPQTASARIDLGPLPDRIAGVPISYRTIRLALDRHGFIRNPTSCEPMWISGHAISSTGATAALSSRFQTSNCATLPFRPRLALRLSGGLGRNGHPALRVVVRPRRGQAGIAGAAFTLPGGELLDVHHLRALCPRQLPAGQCPSRSRLGFARLSSAALGAPLNGSVFLREPRHGLPEVIADLRGEGLHLTLHGRLDTPGGSLRIRLSNLPDLPLDKAVLELPGGRRGIFVNSSTLCGHRHHALAALVAQSGKHRRLHPRLRLRGRC